MSSKHDNILQALQVLDLRTFVPLRNLVIGSEIHGTAKNILAPCWFVASLFHTEEPENSVMSSEFRGTPVRHVVAMVGSPRNACTWNVQYF